MTDNRARKTGTAVALVAAGVVAGGVLASTFAANAADTVGSASSPTSSGSAAPANPNPGDPSKPQRADETLLTGDTAAKVKAAVLAKYPGATIIRLETDSDGAYEAHITKADGTPATIEVDKSFAVTGEEAGRGMGEGRGGHHGGHDGHGGGMDETALTGDTLAKVKAAVLAKYPGATIDRAEADSDGVYEAHITKADGTRTTVEVDKAYKVTGEEAGHHDDHDGGQPAQSESSSQTS